jgi:2-keto-4-pentenoate hydratase/2-oxohepta-3-ene-1,7-dioic acid hydratase in catechol pathway
MRLYTFEVKRQQKVGVEREGKLVELPFMSMLDLINAGKDGITGAKSARGKTHDLKRIKLLAPIPRSGKILCSGLNYKSHIEEEPGAKFLEDPRFFAKLPNCVIGPNQPIRSPGDKFQVDYEVELAVVIGRRMKQGTPPENVMRHIFGYTIFHDVSARWIQFKDANETMGKNFDTFAPMGPCIVTADEIPNPSKLHLKLTLNGKVMQDRANDDWCFPLTRLVSWLSMAMTLEPGDVVTTGTPAGVGFFQKPQVFLKHGDVCELEISGIGKLVNKVVDISR